MTRRRPALSKPSPGWQRDLPEPSAAFERDIHADVQPILNAIDDTYLEISRRSAKMRGLMFVYFLIGVGFFLFLMPDLATLKRMWSLGLVRTARALAPTCSFAAIALLCLRIDTAIPRDEPIRFNRLRRKVYVYSFRIIWWNPFGRWYVTTKTYNWGDLRAELWRQRGFTPQGGLLITWGVSIAVVKPGTNEVIDRFPLSVGQDEGSSWDYVRVYMQLGPQALPPVEELHDPNEVPPLNLALRLAPKVQWPAEMDAESRSAG